MDGENQYKAEGYGLQVTCACATRRVFLQSHACVSSVYLCIYMSVSGGSCITGGGLRPAGDLRWYLQTGRCIAHLFLQLRAKLSMAARSQQLSSLQLARPCFT
jgi:hypothetical protein